MGLRDIELTLPPGFRFYPSDEELVCHYLHNKVANDCFVAAGGGGGGGTMVEVDLHVHEPWELPDVAKLSTNEWYFFSFRDRKYATGLRTNRATKSGYWKATGKDRVIRNPGRHGAGVRGGGGAVVGMRKTLVFYRGRAPNGTKTCWVMHEFRIENPHAPPKEDWVLCRVFHKKKADTEYAMDGGEQEIIMAARSSGAATTRLLDVSSSSCHHDLQAESTYHHNHSPHAAPFPSLGGHYHHHHHLPPSSGGHHHRHGPAAGCSLNDDFHTMPPLLSYDSILDFSQQHLDGATLVVGAGGSRDGTGDDHECAAAPGGGGPAAAVLMELGLDQEHYNYNSLMQM